MHYLAHLFCAFHLSEGLSQSPFTADQLARVRRGEVPDGDL
jgi:hypothetical protein